MLKSIELRNWRSIQSQTIRLGPVNLLIGPNAAGKSNVIDALRLLAEAAQADLETAVTRRGGLESVRFRDAQDKRVSIAIVYSVPDPGTRPGQLLMRYNLTISQGKTDGRPVVAAEELQVRRAGRASSRRLLFRSRRGKGTALRDVKTEQYEDFDTGDPGVLALKALGFLSTFPQIRALREFIEGWQFLSVDLGAIREPHRDERATRLDGRAANLANVLRTLRNSDPSGLERILDNLRDLLHHVTGVETSVEHGRVMLLLTEQPFKVPFDTLAVSDGTLRLLALLTALETMPEHGLLCIEEPEHGLHPLIFGPLLDVLREYCPPQETRQALLTTHSPDLIDTAAPNEVQVVERNAVGATEMRRLPKQQLRKWLRDFRLGELWRMRQIGGVPECSPSLQSTLAHLDNSPCVAAVQQ
jgi:predicted ATPase